MISRLRVLPTNVIKDKTKRKQCKFLNCSCNNLGHTWNDDKYLYHSCKKAEHAVHRTQRANKDRAGIRRRMLNNLNACEFCKGTKLKISTPKLMEELLVEESVEEQPRENKKDGLPLIAGLSSDHTINEDILSVIFLQKDNALTIRLSPRVFVLLDLSDPIWGKCEKHPQILRVKLSNKKHAIKIKPMVEGGYVDAMDIAARLLLPHYIRDFSEAKFRKMLKFDVNYKRDIDLPIWCAIGLCTGNSPGKLTDVNCENGHNLTPALERRYIYCRYCPQNDAKIPLNNLVRTGSVVVTDDGTSANIKIHPLRLNICPRMTHFDEKGSVRTYHAAWITKQGLILH